MTVELDAAVEVSVGKDDLHEKEQRKRPVINREIMPTQVTLNAGAGVLDEITLLAPTRGSMWSLRRLTLWGYTAGTVTVSLDGQEPIFQSTPGMNGYAKGVVLLTASNKLVVTAAGITGNVFVAGRADEFPAWYLAEYLD